MARCYKVKKNTHPAGLLSYFEKSVMNNEFTDVTLSVEGQSIPCHRLVLAAGSTYFEQLFLENPSPQLVVVLAYMKYSEVITLLEFMYKGECTVSDPLELAQLRVNATLLKVKGLQGNDDDDDNDSASGGGQTADDDDVVEAGGDHHHRQGHLGPRRPSAELPSTSRGPPSSAATAGSSVGPLGGIKRAGNAPPPPSLVSLKKVPKMMQNVGVGGVGRRMQGSQALNLVNNPMKRFQQQDRAAQGGGEEDEDEETDTETEICGDNGQSIKNRGNRNHNNEENFSGEDNSSSNDDQEANEDQGDAELKEDVETDEFEGEGDDDDDDASLLYIPPHVARARHNAAGYGKDGKKRDHDHDDALQVDSTSTQNNYDNGANQPGPSRACGGRIYRSMVASWNNVAAHGGNGNGGAGIASGSTWTPPPAHPITRHRTILVGPCPANPTQESCRRAAQMVKNGATLQQAADRCHVPKTTLGDFISRQGLRNTGPAPTVVDLTREADVVEATHERRPQFPFQ